MTPSSVTQSCPYPPHSGPVGGLPGIYVTCKHAIKSNNSLGSCTLFLLDPPRHLFTNPKRPINIRMWKHYVGFKTFLLWPVLQPCHYLKNK